MKTEYLIPIDTSNHFAESEKGFNSLLLANEEIEIHRNKLSFRNMDFKYILQSNKMEKSDINCYHLTIESNVELKDFSFSNKDVIIYLELLKIIKRTFMKYTSDFEILWDDVSFACSRKAYPLIYEMENLMRKLLTKFMLVSVGAKWEKENIPSKISKSKNSDKSINEGNGLLYQLDFIELSTFLFDQYPTKSSISELKELIDNKDETIFEALDQYIPKSNWERYFKNLVPVEDEHLKKKWDELYKLRCKIAHNNLFSVDDLKRTISIVNDLKPSITSAITQLDEINIPEEDKETISESLAISTNDQIATIIYIFNIIHTKLIKIYRCKLGENSTIISPTALTRELMNNNILNAELAQKIQYSIKTRNMVVHYSEYYAFDEVKEIVNRMETANELLTEAFPEVFVEMSNEKK